MAGRAKVQHGVTSETGKGTITLPSLLPSSCCTWHGSALRTRYTSQPFPHPALTMTGTLARRATPNPCASHLKY